MAKERPVMLDDDDSTSASTKTESPTSRAGFEWGLASTLMGAALLIAATGGLLACLLLWFGGRPDYGRGIELKLAEVAGVVMGSAALLFCLIGFFFGLRGFGRARRARQPAALPLAGMLLCLAASLLWLIVTVDFVLIVESFLRWRRY